MKTKSKKQTPLMSNAEFRDRVKHWERAQHQLQVAVGALSIIVKMDEGVNNGAARFGLSISGHVAHMAVIEIERIKMEAIK